MYKTCLLLVLQVIWCPVPLAYTTVSRNSACVHWYERMFIALGLHTRFQCHLYPLDNPTKNIGFIAPSPPPPSQSPAAFVQQLGSATAAVECLPALRSSRVELLTYLLTYLSLTYLLTYLFIYLFTYLLIHLLIY